MVTKAMRTDNEINTMARIISKIDITSDRL